MDAARDAVLLLDVDLGERKKTTFISGIFLDISTRRTVDHLSHLEALDGLVLGHTSAAVDAPHYVAVSLVLLPSSVVPSF